MVFNLADAIVLSIYSGLLFYLGGVAGHYLRLLEQTKYQREHRALDDPFPWGAYLLWQALLWPLYYFQ